MGFRDADVDPDLDHPAGPAHRPRVRFSAIGDGWGLFWEQWATWALTALIVLVGNAALTGAVASVFGTVLPRVEAGSAS